MEAQMKALFDYQKFAKNAALQRVIDEVNSRYAIRELRLDEMEWAAAGVQIPLRKESELGKKP